MFFSPGLLFLCFTFFGDERQPPKGHHPAEAKDRPSFPRCASSWRLFGPKKTHEPSPFWFEFVVISGALFGLHVFWCLLTVYFQFVLFKEDLRNKRCTYIVFNGSISMYINLL